MDELSTVSRMGTAGTATSTLAAGTGEEASSQEVLGPWGQRGIGEAAAGSAGGGGPGGQTEIGGGGGGGGGGGAAEEMDRDDGSDVGCLGI